MICTRTPSTVPVRTPRPGTDTGVARRPRPGHLAATIQALAAAGTVSACGGPTEPSGPMTRASSAPVVIASVDGQTPAPTNPADLRSPHPTIDIDDTVPDAPPPGAGPHRCLDPNSELAQSSINSLNPDPNGGHWEVSRASTNAITAGCGLDWILVNGSGYGDATYTSRVLLFEGGTYLGTVEPKPYPYTSVSTSTSTSVTVTYRWLRDDDAFCCPRGGPTAVTATLVDGAVVRQGSFPPA